MLEREIQNSIIDYLRERAFVDFVFQTDTRPKARKYGAGHYRPKGLSDIVGSFRGGRAFYLECKTETGRVAPHQQAFIEARQQGGAVGAVVRNLEDVKRVLTEAGYSL